MAVVIKDPSSKNEDLTLHPNIGQVETTVKALKELICSSHPLHPSVEVQKLIFGGKVLGDHQRLQDIFVLVLAFVRFCPLKFYSQHQDNDVHVIHLILKLGVQQELERQQSALSQQSPPAASVAREASVETAFVHSPTLQAQPSTSTPVFSPPPQHQASNEFSPQISPMLTPQVPMFSPMPMFGNPDPYMNTMGAMDPAYISQMQMAGGFNPLYMQQMMMAMEYQRMFVISIFIRKNLT